ncbi:hypothetical protein [Xanthomonas sp. 10-10]|uniref:Uncharacterized protein n=1 Tax=Xanthomonas sp. 10-10 TaxID=3115848 RepID=A0AAU7P456_9XANT
MESLNIEANQNLEGADLVMTAMQFPRPQCPPLAAHSEGNEFISMVVDFWAHDNDVSMAYSPPDRPAHRSSNRPTAATSIGDVPQAKFAT